MTIQYMSDKPLPELTPEAVHDVTVSDLHKMKEQYREQWHHYGVVCAYLLNEPGDFHIPLAREYAAEVARIEPSLRIIREEIDARTVAERLVAELRGVVGL